MVQKQVWENTDLLKSASEAPNQPESSVPIFSTVIKAELWGTAWKDVRNSKWVSNKGLKEPSTFLRCLASWQLSRNPLEHRARGRSHSPPSQTRIGEAAARSCFWGGSGAQAPHGKRKDQECERWHQRAPRQLQWTQVEGQMPGLVGAEEMLLGTPDAARHKARLPWLRPQRKQTSFHVFCAHYSRGFYLQLWLSNCAHPQKSTLLSLLIRPEVIR